MKVNILLSTYNGEKYLAEQLDSIRSQTYTDWNLLIRDDGSTDGTVGIIEQYCSLDLRIIFVNKDNRTNIGVVGSFFSLLQYEKADYYLFADQDDVWLPNKVSLQLAAAQQYSSQIPLMVYMDLSVVDSRLKILQKSMIRSQSKHPNVSLVQELTENTVTGGVSLINHSLAKMWTTTQNVIMHDWYTALIAASQGKLIYLDIIGELYRQHGGNVLGARSFKKKLSVLYQPLKWYRKYWDLILSSQNQAENLLNLDLTADNRKMVKAYVTLFEKPLIERIRILQRYRLKKNKLIHSILFTFLVITKIGYNASLSRIAGKSERN